MISFLPYNTLNEMKEFLKKNNLVYDYSLCAETGDYEYTLTDKNTNTVATHMKFIDKHPCCESSGILVTEEYKQENESINLYVMDEFSRFFYEIAKAVQKKAFADINFSKFSRYC